MTCAPVILTTYLINWNNNRVSCHGTFKEQESDLESWARATNIPFNLDEKNLDIFLGRNRNRF